jgi:V8-like Glu-specific endopeptidase
MTDAAGDKSIGSACGARGGRNEFPAEEYWTEERLARARPVPTPELVAMSEAGGSEQPATAGEALPKGPPGHVPGQPPPSYGEEVSLAPQLEPGDVFGPGEAVEVPHPLNYPYSTVGKLFYTQNGKEDEGSATLICPNVLLTAGHCIYDKDKGGKSIAVSFCPGWGYRKKEDPAYKFDCSYLAWQIAWERDKNYAYDYGLVWIDGNPGELIGWLGYAWNQSLDNRIWTAVGYPAPNPLVGGPIMYATTGRYAPSSISGTFGLTNEHMGHGSSGGPWISQMPWSASPANVGEWTRQRYHANGVKSFISQPGTSGSSPYFTQEVHDLVNWISDPANRE